MSKKIKKKELGLGIRALLSNMDQKSESTSQELVKEPSDAVSNIPIAWIKANPYQPRKEFGEAALQELAESLKVHGLIQPVTLRKLGERQYQLISGERRWRAAQLAQLTELPAYIRSANDQEMLEMALIENIQRQDLNAMEVAITYQRLIDECSLTHDELSQRVGKNRSSVTNYLRLLKLPPDAQKAVKTKRLSMGHARALAGVEDTAVQLMLLRRCLTESLSVRALERTIKAMEAGNSAKNKAASRLPEAYEAVRRNLSERLETRIEMKRSSSGKGQIIINFENDKELNRLLDIIED